MTAQAESARTPRVSAHPRVQPIVALHALRALVRDPEDTRAVFTITESLRGRSTLRPFRRFRASPVGRAVLRDRTRLLDHLADAARLAALPDGSLGRAYLAFMAEQNLSAQGLVDASIASRQTALPDDMAFYAERMRDMHDLMHVVTGYGRHPLGEVCVVTFTYAQTRARGLAAIALLGTYKLARALPDQPVLRVVAEAYRHGRRAAWLPEQDWEHLLGAPLEAIRADLNVTAPARYAGLMRDLSAKRAAAAAVPAAA